MRVTQGTRALVTSAARGIGRAPCLLRAFPRAAVYGATKAALRMFGEALGHEPTGTGVSLSVVCPGEIAAALHDTSATACRPGIASAGAPPTPASSPRASW
jgi:NAD(P)-dependent dehydrogenase (short-subunit alcohol dehydrogenase family)